MIARAARFDALGFATLAILSGLGGGIIRDVLPQHGPPAALTDCAYVPTALAGALVVYLIKVEGPVTVSAERGYLRVNPPARANGPARPSLMVTPAGAGCAAGARPSCDDGGHVDVKIGIADNGRELTVSVTESPEEIEKRVTSALQGDPALLLVDDKGRRVIVPTAKIAYVEVGPADSRRVGFAVGG